MEPQALAVGFFRWRQFNVRHPELVDAKEAYREMVGKIEALEEEGWGPPTWPLADDLSLAGLRSHSGALLCAAGGGTERR